MRFAWHGAGGTRIVSSCGGDVTRHNSAKGKIIGAIVVIVIVALAAWWYFTRMPGVDFTRHGPEPPPPAKASTAPLPPLDASDDIVAKALSELPGADGLAGLLLSRGLVPHIVATVDALPRRTIGASILPLRTPEGVFMVDTSSGQPALDAKNYARYAPYMKIVEATDSRTLVTWYVHWYPLFQDAYRQLGYPNGYFNDRLMAAINDMLAAPNAHTPVALARTADGHYAFADPTWESLSVGQKLMIRIGPENERELKAKLRSIRALLLGQAPALHANGTAQPAPSRS